MSAVLLLKYVRVICLSFWPGAISFDSSFIFILTLRNIKESYIYKFCEVNVRWQSHDHHLTCFQKESLFELKLNVTDTEFVVVEDTTAWDTNAVILKVRLGVNMIWNTAHVREVLVVVIVQSSLESDVQILRKCHVVIICGTCIEIESFLVNLLVSVHVCCNLTIRLHA